MKVNDENQHIVFCGNKTFSEACVQVSNNEIKSSPYVKLLGVYFDQNFSFDYRDELCRAEVVCISTLDKDP